MGYQEDEDIQAGSITTPEITTITAQLVDEEQEEAFQEIGRLKRELEELQAAQQQQQQVAVSSAECIVMAEPLHSTSEQLERLLRLQHGKHNNQNKHQTQLLSDSLAGQSASLQITSQSQDQQPNAAAVIKLSLTNERTN